MIKLNLLGVKLMMMVSNMYVWVIPYQITLFSKTPPPQVTLSDLAGKIKKT